MRTTLLLGAALVAAGCVHTDEDATGSVAAALTAVDDDGGVYRLTPDTRLQLYNSTYFDEQPLDADTATVRVDLPVGDYGVALFHPYGYTDAWPLERTDPDGSVQIVTGYLLTPMPQSITIFEDETTSLVLAFAVPEFGDVTFAEGALDVSLEVEETTAGGADVAVGGYYTVGSVWSSPDAPPALSSRLFAEGDPLELSLNARVTGPFAKTSSTTACAPAHLDALGAVDPALIDLVIEANDHQRICVMATEPPRLMIQGYRTGAAITPTFDDLFEGTWYFIGGVLFDLPAPVFDGETLDLDPVVGTITGHGDATYRIGAIVDDTPNDWYVVDLQGDVYMTLTLTP